MTHIPIHKVDLPDSIEFVYDWAIRKYDENINKAKTTFRFLFYVFKDSSEILECNVLLQNGDYDHKRSFHYGLNCISEFCRLAHFPNQEKEAQIDESGRFVVKVEEKDINQLINIHILKALFIAAIARDKDKQKIIADSPLHFYGFTIEDMQKDVFGINFFLLVREFFSVGTFNHDLFNKTQLNVDSERSEIQADVKKKFWAYEMNAFLIAFKYLIDDDESAFNAYLIKALEAHKEVWSQKKALNRGGTPLCRENEGFLSWGLTALAAMAHDKGWKLEVQSDYMPQYMIDGSING